MKYAYTILYVPDVAETAAFYERAFGLTARMVHESGTYTEMETGATVLAFAARENMEMAGKTAGAFDPERPSFEVAFVTDDVPGAFARAVEAGCKPASEPASMPWGQQVSYVTDLNGCLVEICSPVGG